MHSLLGMEWTDTNLSNVDEAARRILSRLQLSRYWFSIVAGRSHCRVRVHYASGGEWRRAKISVSAAELAASQHDQDVRSRLLFEWAERLEGATGATRGNVNQPLSAARAPS